MNQEESLCRPYETAVRCFERIPDRFDYDGSIDEDCSLVFPPGYSVYIEEFNLVDYKNPDNFVLINGDHQGYRPKLQWEDREQTLWTELNKCESNSCEPNPLLKKSTRRELDCIKSLKVTKIIKFLTTLMSTF